MASEESKKGIITAINSKPGNEGFQLQEDGKWHNITGKATAFIKNIQKDAEIEYKTNYKGEIVYFKAITDIPTKESEPRSAPTPAPTQTQDKPLALSLYSQEKKSIKLQAMIKAASSAQFVKSADDITQLADKLYEHLMKKTREKD